MPTRKRPTRTGRPWTEEDTAGLAMCRCPLLSDCHRALHCQQIREGKGGATR